MSGQDLKRGICAMIGVFCASFQEFFSQWDSGILLLVTLMAVDYLTGLYISIVKKKSPKTKNGGCCSEAAFSGLVKKGVMLAIVLIGFLLDNYLHQNFFADSIAIAFIMSEMISLTENAALIGVPLPAVLKQSLELLRVKGNDNKKG